MKKLIFSTVLVLSLGLVGCKGDIQNENFDNNVAKSLNKEASELDSREVAPSGKITEEKFKQITEGMTYKEVIRIVGANGKILSETGTAGKIHHTILYEFETDEALLAANLMFRDGILIKKAKLGMGSSDI